MTDEEDLCKENSDDISLYHLTWWWLFFPEIMNTLHIIFYKTICIQIVALDVEKQFYD